LSADRVPPAPPRDRHEDDPDPALDPTRWATLAISIMSAFIVVLDNTVLNVSIPTMLRDLHTTLPSLEWVITGYALTFAALLIIGGRLGDIYGHRRIFIIGAALFGAGSLLASIATSVGELILGEAIIEGIGASLMLPATLAILSTTFRGRERAGAFAAWGATAGVAAAAGPVVGGFLTTNYSWRWSFRINVIVAPVAMIGAILFMKHTGRSRERVRIDVPGAVLIAAGMFLLVFGLSEGGVYGWWRPTKDFSLAGTRVWPADWPVAVIPVVFVLSALILGAFVWLELAKDRAGTGPLFPFSHFRFKTYRYGLLTSMVLAMGQLGISFVLPVFLQDGKHLSAQTNGLWMLPSGVFVIVGAQTASLLIRRYGTTIVVRVGLVLYAIGIVLILRVVNLGITAWSLLPGLALYGAGIGFAGAQLTNVVLSDIPAESSGVASGANTTMRQVGSALGVSVIGSLLTVQSLKAATSRIASSSLPQAVKQSTLAGVHAAGTGYVPPHSLSAEHASIVRGAIEHGVTTGTRVALVFAIVVIVAGTLMSLLIPRDRPHREEDLATPEPSGAFEPDLASMGDLA
jgi:EmrB/QacA subfamily drug resistance transporter